MKRYLHINPSGSRTLYRLLLSCLLVCTLSSSVAPTQVNYKMHCLYLYKFSQLVKWPVAQQEFTIGVVGVSPILPALEQYIAAKNKSSTIQYKLLRMASAQMVTDCQLLYVTKGQLGGFDIIEKRMAGKPTLLVSEVPGLIKRGTGINLIAEDGASIKVQVNRSGIEQHGLKTSPELLKLATEIF